MPIVISRKGKILEAPVLTPAQQEKGWEAITATWAKAHPDTLRQLLEKASAEACAGT